MERKFKIYSFKATFSRKSSLKILFKLCLNYHIDWINLSQCCLTNLVVLSLFQVNVQVVYVYDAFIWCMHREYVPCYVCEIYIYLNISLSNLHVRQLIKRKKFSEAFQITFVIFKKESIITRNVQSRVGHIVANYFH